MTNIFVGTINPNLLFSRAPMPSCRKVIHRTRKGDPYRKRKHKQPEMLD